MYTIYIIYNILECLSIYKNKRATVTTGMQRVANPKRSNPSLFSNISKSFKTASNAVQPLKLKNNIFLGFCYPIVEAADIKQFNMKRLKNLDFNEVKIKLLECKQEYKTLSKDERKNYLSVITELAESFHRQAQAKLEDFKAPGKNYFFFKISNNCYKSPYINIYCDFTDEEIEMAIKCVCNSSDFPPWEYYEKLANFQSNPELHGNFNLNKSTAALATTTSATGSDIQITDSIYSYAKYTNAYLSTSNKGINNTLATEREKIKVNEFSSNYPIVELTNSDGNIEGNNTHIRNMHIKINSKSNNKTNPQILLTHHNKLGNLVLRNNINMSFSSNNSNNKKQLKRLSTQGNTLMRQQSISQNSNINNKKTLSFLSIYEDLNFMLSETYLRQLYHELIKGNCSKYLSSLNNYERKKFKGQWITYEDLNKNFNYFVLIYKKNNLKISKSFDLNWSNYKADLYNSHKENKVFLISLKSLSPQPEGNSLSMSHVADNSDKVNKTRGFPFNKNINSDKNINTINNSKHNTAEILMKENNLNCNSFNNCKNNNLALNVQNMLGELKDNKMQKISIVVEFTPNSGYFIDIEQQDLNFYIVFDIYEINKDNNINNNSSNKERNIKDSANNLEAKPQQKKNNNNNVNNTNNINTQKNPNDLNDFNFLSAEYTSTNHNNNAVSLHKQLLDSHANVSFSDNSSIDDTSRIEIIPCKAKSKNISYRNVSNTNINFFAARQKKNSNLQLIAENIHLKGFYAIFSKDIFEAEKDYLLLIRSCFAPFGYNLRIFTETGKIEALTHDKYLNDFEGIKILNSFKIPIPNMEVDNYYLLAKMKLKISSIASHLQKNHQKSSCRSSIVVKFSISNSADYYLCQFLDLYMNVNKKQMPDDKQVTRQEYNKACENNTNNQANEKATIKNTFTYNSKKLQLGELISIDLQDISFDDEIIVKILAIFFIIFII